jgi:hypothetical protein
MQRILRIGPELGGIESDPSSPKITYEHANTASDP